jgi:class 3 adenylate cyclase
MEAAERAAGPEQRSGPAPGTAGSAGQLSEVLDLAGEAVASRSRGRAGRYLRGLFGAGHRGRNGGRRSGSSVEAVVSKVLAEGLNLAPFAAPTGTVTLLFSDIESSTQLNARLGDRAWMTLLHEHNDLIRGELAWHGGFEVKSQGDGFMVAFGSASAAVRSSIGIQETLAARNEQAETPFRVRIGAHTGESADFFGGHVNYAAHVAEQAAGGEIVVSSLLRQLVEPSGEFRFSAREPIALKGLDGNQTLHTVAWEPE